MPINASPISETEDIMHCVHKYILANFLGIALSGCSVAGGKDEPEVRPQGVTTYTLRKDGTRDYSKAATLTESNGTTYNLRPDGYRDYTKPATKTDATGRTYQLLRNGEPDYSKPVTQTIR